VPADYSSVAYFYLDGPAPAPPPLPGDLLPSHPEPLKKFVVDGAEEAEDLRETAVVNGGGIWVQDMGNWNYGEQWSNRFALFWSPGAAGSTLTFPLVAKPSDVVVARMVTGPDCGTVTMNISGELQSAPVDLFEKEEGVKEVRIEMPKDIAGKPGVTLTFIGKNPASKGSFVAIDAFVPAAAR